MYIYICIYTHTYIIRLYIKILEYVSIYKYTWISHIGLRYKNYLFFIRKSLILGMFRMMS